MKTDPRVLSTQKSPVIPRVTKEPASIDKDLPLGVVLHGGEKLRKDGLTGKGIKVAVIDSGVEKDHELFDGKVTEQVWFRHGSSLEDDDHGTHVAGTIHLMAPDAEIWDYRVFGDEGWEIDTAISASIYEACFDGVDVINMSLGGRWPSSEMRVAIEYAYKCGVIVVCAAGNEGDGDPLTNERSYPAMWKETLSIAAVRKSEGLAVASFSNSAATVTHAGIGVDVISAKPGGDLKTVHKMSGTSMACPHVCGLICAILDKEAKEKVLAEPHDTVSNDAQLRSALEKYAIDIGVKGPDNSTGLGFVTYLTKEEFDEKW